MLNSIFMKRLYRFSVCAIALFFIIIWVDFIFSIRSSHYHSADDVNFFGPLIGDFLRTGDGSRLMAPQGPHLHLFYKFQTYVSMKYFGWNGYVSPLAGILTLMGLAFLFRHRLTDAELSPKGAAQIGSDKEEHSLGTAKSFLLLFFVNVAFFTALLGHLNQISFRYHMLSLNNPATLGLGALCIYGFARLLTLEPKRIGLWFQIVLVSGVLFIWGLSTAYNYFLLFAIFGMSVAGLLPPFIKAFFLAESSDSLPARFVKFISEYRLALSAAILLFCFVLSYYFVANLGRADSPALGGTFSWTSTIKGAYASTGLTAVPAQKFSVMKGGLALILMLLSSATVFISPAISRIKKLFFLGVCVFIVTFGLGAVWLRGDGSLLAPRYAYAFGLFWISVVWLLGGSLLSRVKSAHEGKMSAGRIGAICDWVSVTILVIFLALSFHAMQAGLKYAGSLRNFHAPRIHSALYTPLDELNEEVLRSSIRCNRPVEVCMVSVLRMRCFANNVRENICAAGTADQMRKAIDDLGSK